MLMQSNFPIQLHYNEFHKSATQPKERDSTSNSPKIPFCNKNMYYSRITQDLHNNVPEIFARKFHTSRGKKCVFHFEFHFVSPTR